MVIYTRGYAGGHTGGGGGCIYGDIYTGVC